MQAQIHTVKGQVMDANTGELLPFVNVVINGDNSRGVIADIDGLFTIESDDSLYRLDFIYIGYDNTTVLLNDLSDPTDLKVTMSSSAFGLQEVVVLAGDNPAHRIVDAAVDNKPLNDPGTLPSFRYSTYLKTTASIIPLDSTGNGKLPFDFVKTDSLPYLMVSEAVIKRRFRAPNQNEERIIGNRISGFKEPLFASVITTLEPFAFYNDIIPVGDDDFVNPISPGATSKYFFQIQDTVFDGSDTVYVISFEPKKGKKFRALKGIAYINTNQFAIQNMIVEPAIEGFLDFKINQRYEFIDGKHWFPVQFNYELVQSVKTDGALNGVQLTSRYDIQDISFETFSADDGKFSEVEVILEDSAAKRDVDFWDKYRPESLSDEEIESYEVLDSIGAELNLDNLIFMLAKLLDGKFPVGNVDLLLSRFFARNEYEDFRLGVGIETNERFDRNWGFGGFVGYGLGDQIVKYGGFVTYRGDFVKDFKVRVGYRNQFRPVGITGLSRFASGIDWASVVADRFDQINSVYTDINYRPMRYVLLKASMNVTRFTPLQEAGVADDLLFSEPYNNTEIQLGVRYAYGEKLVQNLNRLVAQPSKYPILTMVLTRGFEGLLDGDHSYTKLEAAVDQTIRWKYMGKTRLRVASGIIDRSVPDALQFSGEGSDFSFLPFLVPNTFQTSEPYEFISDEFVHMFVKHDFHDLLFQIGKFKPHFALYHNMGWGNVKHREFFDESLYKTKERGFFESGIQIDNLIRFNIASVGYLGLGGAAFYRYGEYARERDRDNLVFNLSLGWTAR